MSQIFPKWRNNEMTKKVLAALLAARVLTMVPVAAGTSTLPGGVI